MVIKSIIGVVCVGSSLLDNHFCWVGRMNSHDYSIPSIAVPHTTMICQTSHNVIEIGRHSFYVAAVNGLNDLGTQPVVLLEDSFNSFKFTTSIFTPQTKLLEFGKSHQNGISDRTTVVSLVIQVVSFRYDFIMVPSEPCHKLVLGVSLRTISHGNPNFVQVDCIWVVHSRIA